MAYIIPHVKDVGVGHGALEVVMGRWARAAAAGPAGRGEVGRWRVRRTDENRTDAIAKSARRRRALITSLILQTGSERRRCQ